MKSLLNIFNGFCAMITLIATYVFLGLVLLIEFIVAIPVVIILFIVSLVTDDDAVGE